MYSGQIIDTHMHLWDRENGYSWLDVVAEGRLPKRFSLSDYLEISRNVPISAMVHIECGGFPQNPVLETDWIQKQADLSGFPQAIIGFVPLDSDQAENLIQGHLQYPNFRGIRMPLNFVAGGFGAKRDDWMRDAAWRKRYALLAKHDLLFEMQIFDTQIPDAIDLAKTYPEIPIVLEHLGWPKEATKQYLQPWKERMAALAMLPNVVLKLSCLGWIFQNKEESLVLSYLQTALALFGSKRCIVGSNYPADKLFLSFDAIFAMLKKVLLPYSLQEQQNVFYANAQRIYRI